MKAYVGYNYSNEREKSSSGGIFSLLAEQIIEAEGYVFGAAFDNDWEVHHICIDDRDGLHRILGSKYVQSSIDNAYQQCKEKLSQGKTVLFSGTPCQIDGLLSYIGEKYKRNLVTVDFLCHGVPSPAVWKSYLTEVSAGKEIKNISFRDKSEGWAEFSLRIEYEDGGEFREPLTSNTYLQGFLRDYYLRPSCYSCKYKSVKRVSDITLGDFWGVEKYYTEVECDYYNGISVVADNTGKASLLLENALSKCWYREVEDEVAFNSNNKNALTGKRVPVERMMFYRSYDGKEGCISTIQSLIDMSFFKKVERKCLTYTDRFFRKEQINASYCTGCSACAEACGVNAITMLPDKEGFLYPAVDEKLCIRCKKCETTCTMSREII